MTEADVGAAAPSSDVVLLARQLAAALNAYERHALEAIDDADGGVHVAAHTDARACSDASAHDPWHDVVARWPGFSAKAKARVHDPAATKRRDLVAGAEVAVLSDGTRDVVVRYIATDKRWVVDEALLV